MRSFDRTVLKLALAFLCYPGAQANTRAPAVPRSDLYNSWKALAVDEGTVETPLLGAWAEGTGERYGQICDVYRTPQNARDPNFQNEDAFPGCVAIWLSEAQDNFTVGDLPTNQQNNFQNTQHYKVSWNYQGTGLKARSLPRAPQDFNPVCYITTNEEGEMTLGYEEGNGDRLLPCPGANGGPPFSEEQLIAANQTGAEGQALLEDYCGACYQSVCSANNARRPRDCGGDRQGGVEVGQGKGDDNVVQMVRQVGPAYHCHMTMADDGACDFVQYDQHEFSREYNMSSAVYCGWERISELQITHCDCTRVAGTANGCGRGEGLKMALKGVACGNCNNVNQDTAYDQIFGTMGSKGADQYDGTCAAATDTSLSEEKRYYMEMMCSQGLFCRNGNLNGDACRFHCSVYPSDPKCPPTEEDEPDAEGEATAATMERSLLDAEMTAEDAVVGERGEESDVAGELYGEYSEVVSGGDEQSVTGVNRMGRGRKLLLL
eukprot:CAMPEP_0197844646 /NCGR_PEP_ID=MMETSP1438-20131217/1641_1 /TAXON_ID=1461541 /ORGANISM="Pterosperma sp., Strain CCMP1384" /LENGTH=489 /DNA_ID=CAMNT_0043455569 /DNA_START=273 /DNA_END=1742 /DNA_ORIENTATION=-